MGHLTSIAHVELFQEAIYRVNRLSIASLSYRSVIVLASLFRAENRSSRITQNDVFFRLTKVHAGRTQIADQEILRRLVEKGYVDKKKDGRAIILSCSVAGRNYVLLLDKTLRSLRSKF